MKPTGRRRGVPRSRRKWTPQELERDFHVDYRRIDGSFLTTRFIYSGPNILLTIYLGIQAFSAV